MTLHPVVEPASSGRTGTPERVRLAVGVGGIATAWLLVATTQVDRLRLGFDPWQQGDWLINYAGGLVRRGLLGDGLLALFPDGTTVVTATVVLQLGIAFVLYACLAVLFWQTRREWAWVMVILSPAVLLFPVLDPLASLRKEVLALAALGLLAVGVRAGRPVPWALIALPLYSVGVLSHESLLVTLPAFVILLAPAWRQPGSRRSVTILLSLFAAVSITALVVAILHPGDSATVSRICASWTAAGLECGGVLDYLDMGVRASVASVLDRFPMVFNYLPLAVLAVVPLVTIRLLPRHWALALVVVGASLPLFALGMDYGRWIYVVSTELALVSLAAWPRLGLRPMQVPGIAVAAFVLLWSVPHFQPELRQSVAQLWLEWVHGAVRALR